ncbi:pyrroloquinoline quinone biosynthesis protein PqqB [Pseudomonas sp. 13.2]|uniref:Coenzyme PQQ synthesis protein B n=1 Tax=Pseudomonas sp. 13.2 TaxID=3144665 RepID=A0AAU7BDB2_9PSED
MYIQVLGSAAGGGFPQWNCNCVNCKGYRDGTLKATARTQSSIALSDDGVHWILCNASPDIRAQLQAFAPMQPARALRDTGINAIVLLDSQIDHTTGLLSLREGCPHQVWCTDMVHQDLTTGFPLFHAQPLERWPAVEPYRAGRQLRDRRLPQPQVHPLPLRSAAPPYSPHRFDPHPGDNLGLMVEDTRTGGKLFYAPGLGQVDEKLLAMMHGADCLLVDGTLWKTTKCSAVAWAPAPAARWVTWPRTALAACWKCSTASRASARYLSTSTTPTRFSMKTHPSAPKSCAGASKVAFDGMSIEL